MPFKFSNLAIPGVILIEPQIFEDSRGYFCELYKLSDFEKAGICTHFVQMNCSVSGKNVLRGLHHQLNPMAQGKLVQVAGGEIFDVAVDLRRSSPYYGRWVAEVLSSKKRNMLYVPQGFAHGFAVLSETATVLYHCTREYSQVLERGILWNDSRLKIEWPLKDPIISSKDMSLPPLESAENNF
ncbi:MAG: dTDP-4-dehydrorhamnose 3,5-epimerase [Candidatus Omnitrophica bacterium]|nr:dTDP-4-dehydrorhamnose 3,5-epimerase [Candidatus Omnitrophota bacterium]MBU4479165.1 dTDP-4-dehydrorhamnose 3,5-epimerase [Candidatus Omnitrophota bacterium]MCG2703097.1 dTDP-4-dehydrorhamnose 3,5-epimerase [Candidatus Omnitrophota bacterium]